MKHKDLEAEPASSPTRKPPEEIILPIEFVEPWPKNPRLVKKRDYDRLKAQVRRLGVYKRLLVCPTPGKAGYFWVLGGNTRWHVLKDRGDTEVKVTVVYPEDEAVMLEYALSDNDHVGLTDEQALAEIAFPVRDRIHLEDYRIDIGQTASLEGLLTSFGPDLETQPEDTVPDPETESRTQLGDLFELGTHRLLCGDATAPWAYQALLEGDKADIIFTDPPYNVAYKSEKLGSIENDDMAPDEFITFSCAFMDRLHAAAKPGAAVYICSGYSSYPPFLYAMKRAGMTFSCPIIWVKESPTMGWEDYHKQHKMILKGRAVKRRTATPILYGWNGGRHYFAKDRFEADVWIMKRRPGQTMLHPTQKPLALVQRALRNSSESGALVLDPFGGSGSTLIAAEREGRRARIIDLDPKYVDVIIRRYAAQGAKTEREIRATLRRVEHDAKGAGAAAVE